MERFRGETLGDRGGQGVGGAGRDGGAGDGMGEEELCKVCGGGGGGGVEWVGEFEEVRALKQARSCEEGAGCGLAFGK